MDNRILYSNNGTIVDLTQDVGKYDSSTYTFAGFTASEDYIYIGTRMPFNHKYIEIATAASAAPTFTVAQWDGDSWENAVEVTDNTSGFASSGELIFVPDRDTSWSLEDTNYGGETITGLSTVTIYDRYWIRIAASLDFASLEIKYIGQKFCEDNDLYSEYPILANTNMKAAHTSGRTDWVDLEIRASDIIAEDLIKKNLIHDRNQLLDPFGLKLACVSKTAEIIFGAMGDDYVDQMVRARQEYQDRLGNIALTVDKDLDGRESPYESKIKAGWLVR